MAAPRHNSHSPELEDHRFPCSSCGSDLRFDPASGDLKCDHCGNTETIPRSTGAMAELDLRAVESDGDAAARMEETRVARCDSCGAEVEFNDDIHARECPFCASPLVAGTGVNRHIKPQAQLPFALTQENAQEAMRSWLGRLWFAPSDLRKAARSKGGMSGIYVPYWTYDAETRSRYTGQRGTVYYETRRVPVVSKGKRRMTNQRVAKVRWRRVSGRVARNFDDILVLASNSLPKRFTDALAPWDLGGLKSYEPKFIAGFRAEAYGKSVRESYPEAQEQMNIVISQDVQRDIGGDRQKIHSLDTDVGRLTFKHVLLPVWMAAYRYRGKTYRFVVNGQTGAVEGERPYSTIKIAIAVIIGLMLALAFAYLQITQG